MESVDLCKKEMAAMLAVIIAGTNANDDNMKWTNPDTNEEETVPRFM